MFDTPGTGGGVATPGTGGGAGAPGEGPVAVAPHEGQASASGLTSAPHFGHFTGPLPTVGGLKHMKLTVPLLVHVRGCPLPKGRLAFQLANATAATGNLRSEISRLPAAQEGLRDNQTLLVCLGGNVLLGNANHEGAHRTYGYDDRGDDEGHRAVPGCVIQRTGHDGDNRRNNRGGQHDRG